MLAAADVDLALGVGDFDAGKQHVAGGQQGGNLVDPGGFVAQQHWAKADVAGSGGQPFCGQLPGVAVLWPPIREGGQRQPGRLQRVGEGVANGRKKFSHFLCGKIRFAKEGDRTNIHTALL